MAGLPLELDNFTLDDNNGTWNVTEADHPSQILGLRMSLPASLLVGAVLSCICILTIAGNVLVVLAVCLERSLRTNIGYFYINLAAADLLLGCLVLPFSATRELLNYWPFGEALCELWAAVDVLCCTASIFSLCVISLDRYIGVTRPLHHNMIVTKRRVVLILFAVWATSAAISVGPLFGWKHPKSYQNMQCNINSSPSYIIFSVVGSFYVPAFVVLYVYRQVYRAAVRETSKLMITLKAQEDRNQTPVESVRIHRGKASVTAEKRLSPPRLSPNSSKPRMAREALSSVKNRIEKFTKEKKAAKTVGIIVGVFLVCWLPFFVMYPIDSMIAKVPELLITMAFWLGYCNSFLNPIIYACSNGHFRRAFRRFLLCGKRQGRFPTMRTEDYTLSSRSSFRRVHSSCSSRDGSRRQQLKIQLQELTVS
ncbi:PREDICTED: LOW QUALITY PROTEIN: alpha-1A adrenergic receptor-like [Branchiostoma belcheri]|uniref:LOW QUALITY PROTEIN: alpha-1A adrenergic receptor-like n=1 Tax=Branchiostoma belcheri TaxID=7741 RepID=A0A6P4ZTD3_BRABE|nr:PREDICTED: LOW QUALITY PROTEIN: alpha-1A adrenergic receptor-like [Branchiostoma belcheri]